MKRLLVTVLLLWLAGTVAAHADPTEPPPVDVDSTATDSGTDLSFVSASTLRAWDTQRLSRADTGPWFQYASVSPCNGYPGRAGSDELCGRAAIMCIAPPGDGPAVAIYSRQTTKAGAPVDGADGQWRARGVTCFPELVPGATNVLTMAMIRDAFHHTDFTVPTVNIQPEGDVTLVNLPTFFQVTFPDSGFGPDEVDHPDPARLLGHRIEVRPRLKSVTYHLGERTIGPTTDLGGPYPSGTVVQTYTQPGKQQVRVDIVYTGQFRVGGSGWIDIPGEVDLQGTPVTLTIREAKSRLYTS